MKKGRKCKSRRGLGEDIPEAEKVFWLLVLEIEVQASCMLGIFCTVKLHP
jgi:hypothetical protein